jgi:excinuclease ABC subunit A
MFCANCNIEYPEFTTQHFSSNRQEGACPNCHGIGQILEVDFDKVIDPMSSYDKAILPRRDSNLGQTILKKLAQKYSMDEQCLWKDLPEWFKEVVLHGDNELLRLNMPNGFMSITYKGVKDILTGQYNKGMLTVDFQAMLDMVTCPECEGAKLRRESLNVFIETPRSTTKSKGNKAEENDRTNIHHLQQRPINEMIDVLERYQNSTDQP